MTGRFLLRGSTTLEVRGTSTGALYSAFQWENGEQAKMEMGFIRTFHKDRRRGSLMSLATSAEFDFKLHKGGVFVSQGGTPFLVGAGSLPCEPQKDDLVLFEHEDTPSGPVVTNWGLYRDFRKAFQPLLEPLIPDHAGMEYEFLLDVLIKGRRFFQPGPFESRTESLNPVVLCSVPFDDMVKLKLSAYFVAMCQDDGVWFVHELKNEITCNSHEGRRRHPSETVRGQLDRLGIRLQSGMNILVRMDVSERLLLERSAQSRSLTVYL